MFDKYYKIIPISHLLKNNKFAKSGEIVKGDRFIDLAYALNGGFCVEATDDDLEAAGIDFDDLDEETVDLATFDKKQLIAYAEENGLDLPEKKNPNKETLLNHILAQLDVE